MHKDFCGSLNPFISCRTGLRSRHPPVPASAQNSPHCRAPGPRREPRSPHRSPAVRLRRLELSLASPSQMHRSNARHRRAQVVRAIRSAGLANTKAPRIQAILRQLSKERGKLSLEFLHKLPLADARNYLLGLKGVGPQTAASVLLFCRGKPVIPVDTHVNRMTKRLGWIGARTSREKAHAILESLLPPKLYFPLHLNLIEHGRKTCKAGKPDCPVCPLKKMCSYHQLSREWSGKSHDKHSIAVMGSACRRNRCLK